MKKQDDSAKQNTSKDSAKQSSEESQSSSLENEKVENLENQLKRAVADYQNLERRITQEKSVWIMAANKDLILKLLPVLDNLFLAQLHITDAGLGLSIQKFLDALYNEGMERIETKDRDFDPNLMECVTVAEGTDNKVLEEVRAGFKINDIVLRPAQVIVGGSAKQNEAN